MELAEVQRVPMAEVLDVIMQAYLESGKFRGAPSCIYAFPPIRFSHADP
jgi:hypothetical protein